MADQAAIDAAELAMFRAASVAARLQQSAPVVTPPKPKHGGIEDNHPWTGGSTTNPRSTPLTPDCMRPIDFKNKRSIYTKCVEGLPSAKHLEVGSGISPGAGTHLVTWLNEITRYLENTGQESVFYIKDTNGNERSLLTHSGMFTPELALAHTEDLTTNGDEYDIKNMETSGTALMNSIGPNLQNLSEPSWDLSSSCGL
jgi:hypothetical protein